MYGIVRVPGGGVVAVGGDIGGYVVTLGCDDIDIAPGLLTCGTAVAVCPCLLAHGHMIVYHRRELGNVEAA